MTSTDSNLAIQPIPNRPPVVDLTGQRFNRWLVLGHLGILKTHGDRMWLSQCDCGTVRGISADHLRTGHSKSCGCYARERTAHLNRTHQESIDGTTSPEFRVFYGAKARCGNPNNPKYARYGGRGIEFRFTSVEQFIACVGRRPGAEYTLDRMDNNGHYEPGNVRWATMREQCNNRCNSLHIEMKGRTQTLTEWCRELGISYRAIYDRIYRYAWEPVKALTTPVRDQPITMNGRSQTLKQWAREYGIRVHTIRTRLRFRWPIEKAITTPVRHWSK